MDEHFIIIPYPRDLKVIAYTFTALPELKKYLTHKKNYLLRELREKILKT